MEGEVANAIDFAPTTLDEPDAVVDEDLDLRRGALGFTDETFVEPTSVVDLVSAYGRLAATIDLEYDHDFPEKRARRAAGSTT